MMKPIGTILFPTLVVSLLTACVATDGPGELGAVVQSDGSDGLLDAALDCAEPDAAAMVRINGCTVLIDTSDDPDLVATALNNRGVAYFELERYQDALGDFDRLVELTPTLASSYVSRGRAYSRLEERRRAIEDFDQAIALDPYDASAYFNRGHTLSRLEEYEVAIADLDRAIELIPNFSDAYLERGLARHDLGMYYGAIEDYDQAIALNPSFPETYQFRGYSRCRLGFENEAYDDWMQADRVGDADRRSLYQNIATELDYYDGAIDGEATPEWHSAIAYWAQVSC
ncbi:MAG: tetratricopeptide repeat protein [Pseudomonadota bacterium]